MKFTYMQDASGHVFQTANTEYHEESKVLTKAEGSRLHRLQCIESVKGLLTGCDTVYGIVRHVSASGMSRNIDLYTIKDNAPIWLTGYAAIICGNRLAKGGGMVVGGCGMDMVHHAASSLVEACGLGYKSFNYRSI